MAFWHQTQKGANIFNKEISRENIKAAKAYGITFIRLSSEKFIHKGKDFLMGDADNYHQLVEEDLNTLKKALDLCAEEDMPVVLTLLSLPGSRWIQSNHNQDDLRIWHNSEYQEQASKFWKDLTLALGQHPALVGYDILNEPHPEKIYGSHEKNISEAQKKTIENQLFKFYYLIINSIRSVDRDIPIIVESSAYGDAKAFEYLKIQNDANVLYSFHMYEPFEYTNIKKNQGKFKYPGEIAGIYWDKEALRNYMLAVIKFQEKHHLPGHRILVGEFGGHRKTAGLPHYFRDLTGIFREQGWHFAFYAFRETWSGMDYELGDKPLPESYWAAIERGETPHVNRKNTYPQFQVLQEALLTQESKK